MFKIDEIGEFCRIEYDIIIEVEIIFYDVKIIEFIVDVYLIVYEIKDFKKFFNIE